MRRLVTFVLALALGAVLLWHFESKRLEEAPRGGAPSPVSVPLDLSPEAWDPPLASPDLPPRDVESTQGAEGQQGGEPVLREGEFVLSSGGLRVGRPRQADDEAAVQVTARDKEPLDEVGTRYRLLDVLAEAFVLSAEGKEALRTRLQSESAEAAMDVDGIGMLRLSGENRALLDSVVVEQLRGTPMAPLTMDAPRLAVWFYEERYESVEDDLVSFRSRSVRGAGRGFRASTEVGSLRFEGGAEVSLDLGEGRLASIVTSGAPSLLSIDEIPRSDGDGRPLGARRLRILASGEVHLQLSEPDAGSEGDLARGAPIGLDAESIDVTLEFRRGEDRPAIVAARADGSVVMRRESDVYRGRTAIFGFDEVGNPVSAELTDEPSLDYRLVGEGGEELRVEVLGAGPLTAVFFPGPEAVAVDGTAGQVGVTFVGPGRVVAVDRGEEITFEESLVSAGLTDSSSFDATLTGEVRANGLLGDLRSEKIVASYAADTGLVMRSSGPTRVSHRPTAGDESYRMRAAGGMFARLTNSGWYVERAETVFAEALGDDPYRVEAGLVRDVDLATNTLSASEDILYRTSWGSAFAPEGLVRGIGFVELTGSVEDPVRLDVLPAERAMQIEDDEVAGVRTGWLRAPSMTVTEETVLTEGGVTAQFELPESVWGLDAQSVLVRREITGASLTEESAPAAPGQVRARRAEEIRIEANFVREARYDAFDASGVFRASRLELDATIVDAADAPDAAPEDGIGLDAERPLRLHLIGGVDAHLVAHPPLGAVPEASGEERPVLQSWDLEAAEAELVRLEPEIDADGNPGKAPFSLTAEDVARCHYEGDGRFLDVEAGRIEAEGAFRPVIDAAQRAQPDLDGSVFVANDSVSVDYRAAADQPSLRARGSVFVLLDGARGTLKPDKGKRVRATGVMPGNGLPYTLVARELQFQDERLEAAEPELDLTDPVEFPDLGVSFERITAGHLVATDETVVFDEGFQGFVEGNRAGRPDISLGFVEVDTQQLKRARGSNDDGQSQRTIGPFEPVPLQEPVAASQESQDDDGIDIGRTQIGGPFEVNLPTLRIRAPNSYQDPEKQRLRLEQASMELPESGITFDADVLWLDVGALLSGGSRDLLIDAASPVVRGGTAEQPWSLECASIESKVVGDEVMITLVAPLITAGDDSARADYLALWVDRAAWSRAGSDLRDPANASPVQVGGAEKPNFLAELLFEIQSEKYARYARAVFMEGGVEIARADQRAAKGSRLYIDLQKSVAWLEDAELVYPLQSRGEEVPLRVRTERFETSEEGALTANGATLTTCDHDVPHFVVRTRLFRLEPRRDGGWRFAARGNQLKFQDGFQLPLPSIGNLVLDDEFGVEGFENEAGEVTPLRDIAIARTARFGTVLGAAFRFDIGKAGEWIAERIGMDPEHLKGKWDTQAQWLGSRGPLIGMGLSLREREPGNEPDEDFRLDAFLGGIPDRGRDRGVIRVPESERDELRLWGYVRSRYPIVRGEWLDVAFSSQTDAGAQPEFYENEFLRFEQRDTFLRWRKSFGADYLTAGVQGRVNDFRSQKEELPSFLAYRGERSIGSFTGTPLLWGGTFEAGYYRRRQGERERDIFSSLPGGADPAIGDAETGRADLRQRVSLPVQTPYSGVKATPFVEARGTAWTDTLNEGGDAARGGVRAGAELSTILHKVTGDGYLHTLAPRFAASADVVYEETDRTPIPLDAIDDPYDGAIYEAGLRALWVRPATFENFDLDVRGILRTDRERGLDDRTELGILTEYITRYGRGVGQIGLRHDARYDMERGETIYSRSALAIRPDEDFLAELQYSQARAIDALELYETAGLLTRWRVDPKWEVETRYVHDLLTDQQLFVEGVLRRFSHDFVFDMSIRDRAGEGSTTISFNFAPLLGWSRSRLGMLDRRR
ncbi:MAG: hypothetical protein VX015_05770 [Planctomycetota bacterium]|nr:hypothetical protein [Planctomycetota bacterium]